MLREYKQVSRPRETPGYRRWFSDDDMDLVVWYSPLGVVRGFQLVYDRDGRPRAFTWHVDAGMVHTGVDDGEDGVPRADLVRARFLERARGLDLELVALVSARLEAFRRPS